jgi:hypothetical protein
VSPFTGFSTEHRDAYIRLRFRAENRRKSHAAEPIINPVVLPDQVVKALDDKIATIVTRLGNLDLSMKLVTEKKIPDFDEMLKNHTESIKRLD